MKNSPSIIILMGVTGSGKTTIGTLLAGRLGWEFFDGDDFHPAANVAKMARGEPLDDGDRTGWLEALAGLIKEHLKAGQSMVLACSALKQRYRDQLNVDKECVQFVYLRGSHELIHARLQRRPNHYMKPGMLASQFSALEEPTDALSVEITQMPGTIIAQIMVAIAS